MLLASVKLQEELSNLFQSQLLHKDDEYRKKLQILLSLNEHKHVDNYSIFL